MKGMKDSKTIEGLEEEKRIIDFNHDMPQQLG